MGNPVQEILQGRGGKKRQDLWLKRGLPFFLLFLTYLGLLLEFPLKRRGLWFLFSSSTISFYFILYVLRKEKNYSIEFLFSLLLLIAGSAQTFAIPWLRMIYFPFIVSLTAFYGLKTVVSLLLLIPFLELSNFMNEEKLIEGITFIVFLASTAVLSLFLVNKIKRKTMVRSSLKTAEEVAQNAGSEIEVKSFSDEKVYLIILDLCLNLMRRLKNSSWLQKK